MAKNDALRIIEKPVGSMKILLYIRKHQKATITGLLRRENLNQRTAYSALENLQREGLIVQKESNGFPLCKYYLLTRKGRSVADRLDNVARILAR